MASSHRLKRKLGDLGIDVSSSKANENFVLIGTPLPALEKSKDLNEFVPVWKQEVRDEKGRRRLHGAFTGGFSAGYFNTVGSKEGWAPSSFVSSRNDRAKKQQSRAEDFMDEEDLQDLKDNRKLVDQNEQMDFSQPVGEAGVDDSDPLVQKLQNIVLPHPSDSAGARILKKMGWKLGQGIGPRVSLRRRRLQDLQATTSKILSLDDVVLTDQDAEADKHKYPPRDTPLLLAPRKDNSHGLGYHPGMGLNESLGRHQVQPTGPNISSGFGLGALNDADEDDLDVYDSGRASAHSKVAYDLAEKEDDSARFHSSKKSRLQPKVSEAFNDGRSVLPNFTISKVPVAEDRWYPPPTVPKGWLPNPSRIMKGLDSEKENEPKPPPTKGVIPHAEWKSGLSADQRGEMLGETPLPAVPRSVFDYMSQKDRERLQAFSASRELHPKEGAPQPSAPLPSQMHIPFLEVHIADAALKGFQPYTSDPPKQARYKAYLNSQADPSQFKPPAPLPSQSIDEYNKELSDYAKSAQIFKPMSDSMAGRFRTAKVVEKGPELKEGLHTPATDGDLIQDQSTGNSEQGVPKEEKELDPKIHAAKAGMYGPLTREVKPWVPDRLLCKRFGVKEPEVLVSEMMPSKTDGDPDALREEELSKAEENVALLDGPSGPRDLANVGLGDDKYQGQDTLTYQRPSMDIFKAIFADDEEEDSDHEEDPDNQVPVPEPAKTALPAGEENRHAAALAPQKEEVDAATFKPIFVPREARKINEDEAGPRNLKKRKKERKSKLVSFDVDDNEETGPGNPPEQSRRKKRKKEKAKEEQDAMWVEKPPPEVVQDVHGGNSRRGRAADFI